MIRGKIFFSNRVTEFFEFSSLATAAIESVFAADAAALVAGTFVCAACER